MMVATGLLLAAAVGIYLVADERYVYTEARNYQELRNYTPEEDKTEALSPEISEKVIAHISFDETEINFPIVQGEDNLEYLSKDPEGNYSAAGSIFLDFRNQADFTDPYSVIYGHHMPDQLMFGVLDNFADPYFFQEHRKGVLSLPDRRIGFQTAAFLITEAGSPEIFEPGYLADYQQYFAERAAIFEPEAMSGHLVALTTCAEDAARYREVLVLALEE